MPARPLVVLGLAAVLAGCGFRPLLKQVDNAGVRSELEAVEIKGLSGREGYLVESSLSNGLNPTGVSVPPRYVLEVRLGRQINALGIQLDNTITRFNLTLTAHFQLHDRSNQQVLYRSTVRRVASYNASTAPYSELTAELDAERRAASEVGNDIRTQLSVYFARKAEAA
jgi:LPS-assembly lipoprotein